MCHVNNVQLYPFSFFYIGISKKLPRTVFSKVLGATSLLQHLALLSDSKKVMGSVSGLGADVSVICSSSLCEFSPGYLGSLPFKTIHIRPHSLVGESKCGSLFLLSKKVPIIMILQLHKITVKTLSSQVRH